MNSTA